MTHCCVVLKATRGCGHVRCFQDPTARAKLTETRAITKLTNDEQFA